MDDLNAGQGCARAVLWGIFIMLIVSLLIMLVSTGMLH